MVAKAERSRTNNNESHIPRPAELIQVRCYAIRYSEGFNPYTNRNPNSKSLTLYNPNRTL